MEPYAPNPILEALYQRFFKHIKVDETWVRSIREASERGTVVYVQRNLSFVDFLALDHLTKREQLPRVHFANDLGLFLLEPMGRGWSRAIERALQSEDDSAVLDRVLTEGNSAALFLKRPPTVLESGARGQVEGDAFLQTLLRVQRKTERPILLCPQVFVWSRNPDQAKTSGLDWVFGPREWPGKVRTVAQFFLNYRDVTLRSGAPIDLRDYANGSDDAAAVRRLTYTLLRRLERERRSVTGPVQKPIDRVRDEVIRSPKLARTIADIAGDDPSARRDIAERAQTMLRELETTLDTNAIAALDRAFDATVARMYSAFEVDLAGLENLRTLSKSGTVVLLPCHRSHLDYIVMTRVFFQARMPVPLVAAGDNLDFFPVGPILRRAGAFFIRRSFQGDRLYGAVVDAYMRRLIKEGHPLEFFLEGGRSRSGKVLSPKLGLLSIVVDAALGNPERPVWFCPVSISYERTVEERAYASELVGGQKPKEGFKGLLKSAKILAKQYGRVSVQFGKAISLDEMALEVGAPPSTASERPTPSKRRAMIARLAHRVMYEINHVTAVTAGALVATVLLSHDKRGLAHGELVEACETLAVFLRGEGARMSRALERDVEGPRGGLRENAILEACELFHKAGHLGIHEVAPVEGSDRKRPHAHAIYTVPEDARVHLDQSKNSLVHFFVARALVATAILTANAQSDALAVRVQNLSRLFKFEFIYRVDQEFTETFEETVAGLIREGLLRRTPESQDMLAVAKPRELNDYAQLLKNFMESYRIAARSLLALLKGPIAAKYLVKRAIAQGERMYLAREIERRESISGPSFENAFRAFVDQGFLVYDAGTYALTESFGTAKAAAAIEKRIAVFLSDEPGS
jgi:glycerol-3-phosphate O-acyltransferase